MISTFSLMKVAKIVGYGATINESTDYGIFVFIA
jgi:hypothetical protein